MSEHTHGPWEVGQHPALSRGWIVKPVLFGPNVRALPAQEGGHVMLRNEADAHIIAAGLEMLDALRLVAMSYGWQHMSDEAKDIVRAAIAKAEGRS